MKTQTNPTSGADAFHAWASGAKEKAPEEKARDAQYSAARPSMEEEFDRVSKENYERIDREVVDAIEETDRICKRADRRAMATTPLNCKERKAVRELIGWQERLLVWMFRIAFLTFMYMYWHVTDVRIRQSMERIDSLEEKVEQLNWICNPTNLLPEAICFDDSTMIARN